MAKALIISDNEVLNSLYTVNFQTYLDMNCDVISSLDEVVDVIRSDDFDYSAIICLCRIGDEDVALAVYHHLIENDRTSNLLVIGKQSDVPQEITLIKNFYDIRGILQTVAKSLNISAKDMANKNVQLYYPLPIRLFFSLDNVSSDTFYKVRLESGDFEYVKIFSKDEPIWPKIRNYIDEGVAVLYVDSKDRFLMAKATTSQLIDKINNLNHATSAQKLDIVEQGIETIAEQIFDGELTKEIVELSNKCMEVMEEVIDELPDIKSLLKDLMSNKSGFLYGHSIVTGFVASHVLDNIEWGGDAHKDKLKFVLFFHDMYLVQIYKKYPDLSFEENLLFDEKLSEAEKEVVISHAVEASNTIKRFPKCPIGVDSIILQHHGTSNGLGFATTYKDDISPLAKVLIVSEAFTEELFKAVKRGEKVNIPEIIQHLIEKFPKHTYVKLTKTLENLRL